MSSPKAILCIETATKNCSVSISIDGKLDSIQELESEDYIHSEKLAVFIDQVIKESSVTLQELAAVAVSAGPGSYTGLRIGVSTAKGICLGASLPLIAIPNLYQLAHTAVELNSTYDFYIPMLDARRMEVYGAIYDSQLNEIQATQAMIIDEQSLAELKGKKVAIFGDGAEKCLTALSGVQVELIDVKCSALNMGALALSKFENQDFEDLAYYEPFYLKDFVAGAPKKIF